jgi:diguanylate cyclase (GGDEF)-like protein/PAS domain S-box-containing protein
MRSGNLPGKRKEKEAKVGVNGMAIGTRLGLAFGLVMAALAAIGIFSLVNSTRGLATLVEMKNNADSTVALANARSTVWALRWGVAQFIAVTDAGEAAAIVADSPGLRRQFDDAVNAYRSGPRSDAEKAVLKDLDAAMDKYSGARLKWFELHGAGRFKEASKLRVVDLTPAGGAAVKALSTLIDMQKELSDSAERNAVSSMTAARAVLLLLALAALALAVSLTWLITRGLLRQLGGEPAYATEVANRIAAGDLSQRVALKSGDTTSLMASMSKMQRDLNERIEAERKSAAENLRLEKRLSSLLDIAPDAVVAADARYRIVVFNKSAETIFGYAAAEIIGRPLEDLMPARFAGNHHKHLAAFAREPDPAREMSSRAGLVGLRRDGGEFPVEASISILEEETGPIFFAILRDATEKNRAAQELEHRATHDSLTGLPNRTLFIDRLSHALAMAERDEKLAALMFIDLDGFKRVNDSLGHAAGDELLCAVAQRLLQSVRRSDTVARLGGDEFAVILEQVENVDSVSVIAEKIVAQVQRPFGLAQGEVVVSASVGITICPFDAKTVKELMVDADRAMYFAKVSGKDRFEFYSAGLAAADARGLH